MPVLTSGNFWVCPATSGGTRDVGEEILLDPKPTHTDYGDRLNYTLHESEGRVTKQRSLKNPKTKKWVWEKYRPDVPKYEAQYWTLFNMQEHINVYVNSGSPYVYLKENVTDGLTIYNSGTGMLESDWIRCRILVVQRDVRKGGGIVAFENTEVIFTVDDNNIGTQY